VESDNDESEGQDIPTARRGGLLPPIKLTPQHQSINLPGSIFVKILIFLKLSNLIFKRWDSGKDSEILSKAKLLKDLQIM